MALLVVAAGPAKAQGRLSLDRLLDPGWGDGAASICARISRNPPPADGPGGLSPAHERILDAARSACLTGVMHIRHYPLQDRGRDREVDCDGNQLELPRQDFNFLGLAITEISKSVGRPLAVIIDCVAIDELTFGHYEADVTDDLNVRIGKLIIRDSRFDRVSISHMGVDDVVQISRSQIGSLHLASLRVSGDVVISAVRFGTTSLINSRIDNNLVFSGVELTKTFSLNRVSVGRGLYFGYNLSDYAFTKGMQTGGATAEVSIFSISEVTAGSVISFNDARIAASSEITLNNLQARNLLFRGAELTMRPRRSSGGVEQPTDRKPGSAVVDDAGGEAVVIAPRRPPVIAILGARVADIMEFNGVTANVPLVATNLTAGRLDIEGSTFTAGLALPSCDVGRLSFLAASTGAGDNRLEGRLDLSDCRFREAVLAHALFHGVDCSGCRFENYLLLAASFAQAVNLEGMTLMGGLRLGVGDKGPRWLPGSSLSLAGVRTPRIHLNADDLSYAAETEGQTTRQPVRTKLSGAEYQYLAPRVESEASLTQQPSTRRSSFALQDVAWLRRWLLSGMSSFDPQPFATLSKVLVDGGNRDAANDLHVHRVGALLAQSDSLASHIKLIVGWPIGWGYKPDWVIYGLMLLTVTGAVIWGWLAWPIHAPVDHRWTRGEWPVALRRSCAFVGICVAASVFRLFPNFSDIWKIVPPLGTDEAGEPVMPRYFIMHTIIGSLLVFLLLTPLVGLFD